MEQNISTGSPESTGTVLGINGDAYMYSAYNTPGSVGAVGKFIVQDVGDNYGFGLHRYRFYNTATGKVAAVSADGTRVVQIANPAIADVERTLFDITEQSNNRKTVSFGIKFWGEVGTSGARPVGILNFAQGMFMTIDISPAALMAWNDLRAPAPVPLLYSLTNRCEQPIPVTTYPNIFGFYTSRTACLDAAVPPLFNYKPSVSRQTCDVDYVCNPLNDAECFTTRSVCEAAIGIGYAIDTVTRLCTRSQCVPNGTTCFETLAACENNVPDLWQHVNGVCVVSACTPNSVANGCYTTIECQVPTTSADRFKRVGADCIRQQCDAATDPTTCFQSLPECQGLVTGEYTFDGTACVPCTGQSMCYANYAACIDANKGYKPDYMRKVCDHVYCNGQTDTTCFPTAADCTKLFCKAMDESCLPEECCAGMKCYKSTCVNKDCVEENAACIPSTTADPCCGSLACFANADGVNKCMVRLTPTPSDTNWKLIGGVISGVLLLLVVLFVVYMMLQKKKPAVATAAVQQKPKPVR